MSSTTQTYKEMCKQHIIDTLGEYEGQEVYMADLGYTLTESENNTGSWYCSTYKAEQDLKAWFDDVGEFMEEYQSEFGEKPQHDAFLQPELFHCLMMIVGVEKTLNELDIGSYRCFLYSDKYNGTTTLDKKLIKDIIEDLKEDLKG